MICDKKLYMRACTIKNMIYDKRIEHACMLIDIFNNLLQMEVPIR